MQPRGVMVAQVILVHFVEVRILTGLPFFFASYRGLSRAFAALLTRSHTGVCSLVRALQKHDIDSRYFAKLFVTNTLFSYCFATAGLTPCRKDFFKRLPSVTRPCGSPLLRLAFASNPYARCHFFARISGKKHEACLSRRSP